MSWSPVEKVAIPEQAQLAVLDPTRRCNDSVVEIVTSVPLECTSLVFFAQSVRSFQLATKTALLVHANPEGKVTAVVRYKILTCVLSLKCHL